MLKKPRLKTFFTWAFLIFGGVIFRPSDAFSHATNIVSDIGEFQSQFSSAASINAARSQFSKVTEIFLAAAKIKSAAKLQELAKYLGESFFHPAFNDPTINYDLRRSTLEEMSEDLYNRFRESQSFLSVEHITILETELEKVLKQKKEERRNARKGIIKIWLHGVPPWLTLEGMVSFIKWRLKKRDKHTTVAEIIDESRITSQEDVKITKTQRCKRIVSAFGGFMWDRRKLALRTSIGSAGLSIPIYFGILRTREKHALSETIVKRKLKPLLNSYKHSISN